MSEHKELSTDVLVVGGGLAGCFAAYRAAQMGAHVLLVDKARVGTTGCSTFAAGDILWWTPNDDLKTWINNYARWGGYLLDPEWFVLLCQDIYERVLEMDRWGAPFERDRKGNLARKPGRGHNAAVVFPGVKLMDLMRKKVLEVGARIVDRVMITDLVVEDGDLTGAVGFDIVNGDFYVIEAKSVVLAAGGCSWKGNYFGQDMVCGEAYALAYRHGAQLIHMEYSNTYNSTHPRFDVYGMSRFQRLGGKFTNASGERFMDKYDPELGDGAFCHTLAFGMAKEVQEGRGPIYFDLFDMKEEDRVLSRKLLPMLIQMFDQAGIDLFNERLEWVPAFQGSVGTASGIHLVDHFCSSSAPGIYAAGDAAAEGLVIGGINGPGAINLTWAIVTGHRSGEGAARKAQSRPEKKVSKHLVPDLRSLTFSYLERDGDVKPQDAYYQLQDLVIGWDKSIIRHEKRMKTGLAAVDRLRSEVLPRIKADDPHQLMRAHEVEATLLTTELVLRSALYRTESRAGHFREDYPDSDNANWLKWVTVQKGDEGPRVEAIAIPKHRYEQYGVTLPG
jgi:succinate dehydrogenase/fumarate reductase flavoprotein subunit